MEVHIEVQAEDVPQGLVVESHRAFFTMVAVDRKGESYRFLRRSRKLPRRKNCLPGRYDGGSCAWYWPDGCAPDEAQELRSIFFDIPPRMSDQNLAFLPFFLREPIYVVPEAALPLLKKKHYLTLPHRGEESKASCYWYTNRITHFWLPTTKPFSKRYYGPPR